jgi:hypothetical protein
MERKFERCRPEDLRIGDIVKGNCALWRVTAFSTPRHSIKEMVEVECVDPQGTRPFEVGFSKQFVRTPREGFWERQILEEARP